MLYGVISETFFSPLVNFGRTTGTVRLVKNPPAEYHGGGTNTHFYDVQHWSTLEEARTNFNDVKRSYGDDSGVQFIDETWLKPPVDNTRSNT